MRNLFAVIIATFLVSCASLPTPDQSAGGLLVIPLEITNKGTGNFSFVYTMEITDTSGNSVAQARIDPMVHKNIYISQPIPAGIYQIKEMYSRPQRAGNSRYSYKDQAVPVELYFEIKEDAVTVFDRTFTVLRTQRDRSFSTWWDFRKGFSDESKKEKYESVFARKFSETAWEI